MPSFSPLSSTPLGALPGDDAPIPAGLFPDIGETLLLAEDSSLTFLNVLFADGVAEIDRGDNYLANVLASSGACSSAGVANVRAKMQASDTFTVDLDSASAILSVLKERITVMAQGDARGLFKNTLTQGAAFTDVVGAAWNMLVADAGGASDAIDYKLRKAALIADTINAMAGVSGKLTAMIAVAIAAALEDSAGSGWSAVAADQAAFTESVAAKLAAIMAVADSASVADAATSTLRMLVIAEDGVELHDGISSVARALDELRDGAIAYCTVRVGGSEYQGWVMNTDLRAVTEYRNVPFDSFAQFNGRAYAAGENGLFELTGETDNGAPVDAWVRTFLSDFGTRKMKRVTDVWVGTESDKLLVKIHTKDPATGRITEDIYLSGDARGVGSDKVRVKVGRGLKSSAWAMTVANVNGGQFDVSSIEWKPLILDRRQ